MRTYDARGRVIRRTAQAGCVEHFIRDAVGRRVARIDQLGHVSRVEYTKTGAVSRVLDARDLPIVFELDRLDRVVATVDALGFRTSQELDADGLVVLTVNARGKTYRYRFDQLRRLVEVTDPIGGKVTRVYK